MQKFEDNLVSGTVKANHTFSLLNFYTTSI